MTTPSVRSPSTGSPSSTSTSTSAPTTPTRSARLADVGVPTPVDPPVQVSLAGISAPVDPVALDGDRQVVVPDDVNRAGWYSPGPAPGSASGSAVLVGHVDDREQGLGVFAVLADAEPGDEVTVELGSGRRVDHRVVGLGQFGKAELPLADLFAADGAPRLTLISCGGDFDEATGSYTDNIVVTAVPVGTLR